MLKLDGVPNTVPSDHQDNDPDGAPNAADASTRSDGRPGERGRHFVTWPAHVCERFVAVRISKELAYISGDPLAIDSEKICRQCL